MAARRSRVEAFRERWSRRPAGDRWLLAALALILLLIAVAVWRTAALTVLFLVPVAACIVLALLRPGAREWLIENAIPLGALLLSGWLLGAFVLWVVVNAVWAGQAPRPAGDHASLTVGGAPLTAAASYPSVALADATDNALQFSFSADTAAPLPREVLTATVTLSDTLAFAAGGGPSQRDFLVPLTLGQPGSQRIGIVNSGVYGRWRGQEATIAVRLCAAGGACAEDLTLTVRPEGRNGYAIRRFVSSTIDQSSPIILLLLFVVPGVAVWAQRTLNDQRAALEKQRAEECDRIVKRFRGHFCAEQIGRAAKDLEELNQTRYRKFAKFEREFATELHRLATLSYSLPEKSENPRWHEWPDADLLGMIEQNPGWPRELVTAGLLAYQRLKDPALEKHYRELGSGFDFEVTVLQRLQEFHDDVWPAVMQASLAATDRLKAECEKTNRDRFDALIRRRPVLAKMGLSAYATTDRRFKTPFAQGDASQTEESRFLRDGQAFWGNHPLLHDLHRGDHSVVVRGADGSGRTALAHVLPLEYVNYPADLFVRVEAGATRPEIVSQVAGQLLRFVLRQPIFLGHCEARQKQRLTAFLATWLDSDRLRTGIRQTLKQLDLDQSLRENRLAADELKKFESLLPSPAPRPALDDDDWFREFLEPVHILEFDNVVFVITLSRPHFDWMMKLGNFKMLGERGIHFWLFGDDSLGDEVAVVLHDAPGVAYDLRLAWEEKSYFRAMLDWRFEKFLDAANLLPRRERRRALVTCFDREADLERLIAASRMNGEYNPRRFMTLWRAAVGDKEVGQMITSADVDRALAGGGAT